MIDRRKKQHVAIILGYFNGESYIEEQLRSIFDQSHAALHVFLCDDQSVNPFDVNKLNLDAGQLARLSVEVRLKNVGLAKSFLNTLANVDDSFEYFAFSDQDDIWYTNKLERALDALSKISSDMPSLYCARTEITDDSCEHTLGYSPRFSKKPSFLNAIVQNIGAGNTMVFNKAARDLIVASTRNSTVVLHDWWCYLIITGAGGHVIYDPEPCLKYRQHANNIIGGNTSWFARFLRVCGLLQGRSRVWSSVNIKALTENEHLLTTECQLIFRCFVEARQSNLFKRLMLFKRSGIFCQTLLGSFSLFLGILLNKI